MHIANPIYDTVFKYLMEDKKSAILLLSKIIEEEIVELDFLPQEHTLQIEQRSLTVYRIDFSAKIKLEDNTHKQVIIEIQKAKLPTDIMRFRRYLGQQYTNPDNVYTEKDGSKKALPIISVYFLGTRLRNIRSAVIKVKRDYYDASGKKLNKKEEFIESLTHDSVVIQIPELKEPYQNDIEKLLIIFDQNYAVGNRHKLNIKESIYPKQYKRLMHRLIKAFSEPKIREAMEIEDDILEDMGNMERELKEKDEKLKEQNNAIEMLKKEKEVQDEKIKNQDGIIETLQKKMEELTQQITKGI